MRFFLQYDVDNDGKPDIIIITSDGHFHFYDHKGNTLENATFKVFILFCLKAFIFGIYPKKNYIKLRKF